MDTHIQLKQVQQKIGFYLEDIETPVGKAINLLIAGLVLLSSAIFVVETYPISDSLRMQLDAIDQGILLIFVVEYLLRLWCAENRLHFLLSLNSIVDLLAILPFLIGVLNSKFIRVFRWFRILRLIRLMKVGQSLATSPVKTALSSPAFF